VRLPVINHIDLIEVAPGVQVGLKLYGGRMHTQTLQDLPIEPDASITPDQRETLRLYCGNDLTQTAELYRALIPQLTLREQMGEQYGLDLRSKSDAQIAEAVIKSEIETIQGKRLYRPELNYDDFSYTVPQWVKYDTELLQGVLDTVVSTRFVVKPDGSVELPKVITDLKIAIGSSTYRMGIGGLHSSEKKVNYVTDGTFVLRDFDVASYYPSIILNERLFPASIGVDFLDVYRSVFTRRLEAKRTDDKVVADSLKIVLNSTYGKLGNKWSVLYSPTLMIQVTITGQLALLMLIERMELAGIPVISANTDGVVMRCPVEKEDTMLEVVRQWEQDTGFDTEETRYSALYSRDVNNYLAIKPNGGIKVKGVLATTGLQKNPTNAVVVEAVVTQLTKGVPVSETIAACTDMRKFLTVRRVNGGAVQGDRYLGKVVRWYYSTESPGPITYKTNGNKVAKSDGSMAMMNLCGIPPDMDYSRYNAEAHDILTHLGVMY
jgi:hypothetical protein